MRLNNGTGSVVVLIGMLDNCELLKMDDQGNFYVQITLILHDQIRSHELHKFNVIIEGDSALRIKQYGFHGLRLWIEGCFKVENAVPQIVANKVTFLDCKDPDVFRVSENDGSIRLNDQKKTAEIVLH